MVGLILDRIREVAEVDAVHVVTNSRFAPDFERWSAARPGVTVHDDGMSTNEDRLGAIGDVAFTLERAAIDDDVLVIAGDNLFDFGLDDYVAFWRRQGVASAVAVHDVRDLRLASQYGSSASTPTNGSSSSSKSRPSRRAPWPRPRPTSTTGARATRRAVPGGGQRARPVRVSRLRASRCTRTRSTGGGRHRRSRAAARRGQPARRERGRRNGRNTRSTSAQ